ncbi:McrC family protein [Alkalimonas sp. MEB108]|uniref:McrC family protein n=1 Tax=Alkalimonas cellulosilytica TaxID=3058395 RepID=A0ABU7J175_9GAMM|nr:McrC family protein [Alkalimonas sp. MEB108]MEE2000030.1 McrC family protein [Alkalimonas sp. MEB108]
MQPVVVREYARLTTAPLAQNTLDAAHIAPSAFNWLVKLGQQFKANGLQLLQLDDQQWLRLDNYVGVLESPCGQVIEILPKHRVESECKQSARKLLRKLILNAMQLKQRETEQTDIERFDAPLPEWLMAQFLTELDALVKRGMRFDYQRVEEPQRFLRGQLDVVKQLRQPAGRAHIFHIRHDIFTANRPENRLLKAALVKVCKTTQDNDNWRLAHELQSLLHELPASNDVQSDFKAWQTDRLMAHYQGIKPWCEFVLSQHVPLAVQGQWQGISMLFPMERLFESYVAAKLDVAAQRMPGMQGQVNTQLSSKFLCTHQGKSFFQLKPDLQLKLGDERWILDTKWKLLDASDRENKYGLSQQDFYQLFAYGQYYLGGAGTLVLIYPAWQRFTASSELGEFYFNDQLRLLVLPFDLEAEESAKNLILKLQQGIKHKLQLHG